jgi:hypothetical protein
MLGINISPLEITHVSAHGFWLWVDEQEFFLSFKAFPWFKAANITQLNQIERPTHNHLYWPDLDIDLTLDSIKHPHNFPLIAQ